jgi:predicted alpha-1,2-mannosidase
MNDDWWVWGPVSTTLEYCYSDWTIAQLAKNLGKENYYNLFYERSLLYKNLFDKSSLFMRPKLKDGSWLSPFDSLATEGSGYWEGSGGPGYVEGNAWHYTWFVPHDVNGLIDLFGGEKTFSDKLLRAFSENHFTINNEPDINYPYLFTYIKGKEHLSRELISKIIDENFGIEADGLPGNDDCGTISGWLVFSALGFYPVSPASNEYRIGIPLFDKITIQLNNKYFPGESINILKENKNFIEVIFNKKKINYSLDHNELIKGGELIFK